jgi:hypothetical protein
MASDGEKGDDSSLPCTVVVERVIGSTGEFPKLTKTNYHEWALEVQVNLEGMELWDAVEGGNAERGKDQRALATILRGVPPKMKSGLATKKTVKEAWAAIKSLRMGDARVQEARRNTSSSSSRTRRSRTARQWTTSPCVLTLSPWSFVSWGRRWRSHAS